MIYTARQLDDLHKSNGHVTLPVGSRVTPMASDWLRAKKIVVRYGNGATPASTSNGASKPAAAAPVATGVAPGLPSPAGQVLWWCDGPCGAAKAAVAQQARETNLQPMPVTAEPKYLVAAIKHLAGEIKTDRATAGVLLVQSGAAAAVYANRCPSLRAILGTCRDAVQQGIELVGANVLVIETPHLTLQQARNVLSLFARMRREPSDEVRQLLKDLATCE